MNHTLATRRSAGLASGTPRKTSRAVFLIDYLTWHARLTGSTRPLSADQPSSDGVTTAAGTPAEAKTDSRIARAA
jgi:hypothetical protein